MAATRHTRTYCAILSYAEALVARSIKLTLQARECVAHMQRSAVWQGEPENAYENAAKSPRQTAIDENVNCCALRAQMMLQRSAAGVAYHALQRTTTTACIRTIIPGKMHFSLL